MASDLISKWAAARDPVHRGLSLRSVATGMSLTRGRSWVMVAGGYLLARGTSVAGIDRTRLVGARLAGATTIAPFAWIGQAPSTTYFYELVAVGAGGVEAVANAQDRQIVRVVTGADGQVGSPMPASPRSLRVAALSGGRLRVSWQYVPGSTPAATFRIYSDGGTGTVDWQTPVGQVAVRLSSAGEGSYAWTSQAFAHGTTVKFGVRAATSAGVEDDNTTVAMGQADAVGPEAHAIAAVDWGADE